MKSHTKQVQVQSGARGTHNSHDPTRLSIPSNSMQHQTMLLHQFKQARLWSNSTYILGLQTILPLPLSGRHWWWSDLKTVSNTETTSVLMVKWLIQSSLFGCWRLITMAAPPMNPTMAAGERRSTRKPSLNVPNMDWKVPAKEVTVKTSLYERTFSCINTSAM